MFSPLLFKFAFETVKCQLCALGSMGTRDETSATYGHVAPSIYWMNSALMAISGIHGTGLGRVLDLGALALTGFPLTFNDNYPHSNNTNIYSFFHTLPLLSVTHGPNLKERNQLCREALDH